MKAMHSSVMLRKRSGKPSAGVLLILTADQRGAGGANPAQRPRFLFPWGRSERMPHRTLLKIAGYILGEFGHTIAEMEGSKAEDQLRVLHEHFLQVAC